MTPDRGGPRGFSPALSVTTPEHVSIALEVAGPGSRFLALLVDVVIAQGAASLATLLLQLLAPRALGVPLAVTVSFVIQWGYHVTCETFRQGRSFGKSMLGLRVMDDRGLPLTVRQSLVRNVVRALDVLPLGYGVAAAVALADPLHRRLGDIAAGTIVVRDTMPAARARELPRSPMFNSLDTPRLRRLVRHRIGLEEREVLLELIVRADVLEPDARHDLMEHVAASYRRRFDLEAAHLSDEALVRDLAALAWTSSSQRSA